MSNKLLHATSLLLGFFLLVLPTESMQAQELDMDLFKSMKARSIGPAGMSGRITAIEAVSSNPEIIYAGSASGGLWKSESGGIDWEPIFDKEKVASIGSISIFQKNPSIVWVGTGEGNPRNSQTSGAGIYRSLDGGKSWDLMGLENTRNIHRVIVHPENPEIVYAGVQGSAWGDHPERGVYKTTDGGENWEKILYTNEQTGVGDMVMDPSNPNKLIVAMWQFYRKPWTLKSGGEGSAMYITHDGGKNWTKKTAEDGLPKGELGRMGLAIAASDPNRVYALIESKKNAFYRSDDGGVSWRMTSSKDEIGNRPFYYYDIFVDPQNENRIYSIHSRVTISEDGGKNFSYLFDYSAVHPDFHAFYAHPENSDLVMLGNDGGMAISRNRGKTWRFIENLPLAQYYHINIDNEYPYNVYGGMQDNGSWRGPAYTWRSGGIRNGYFEELFFGDGFDVVPDPEHADRYGYAMSQGGNVGRYDLKTGNTSFIKPLHPDGEFLRFNWNAGIAQDPHDPATIYYGSQYVHKSTDRGANWEIISPDLTTNDPEKQKQLQSGGLTYDVTQAENHTTILAIAPSPLEKEVIWVGTDDGNLQLTQDGGKSWNNLNEKLEGVPMGSWIPQIHPSTYNEGEAFVVVNNYRRNDWTPFLYKLTNYGKKVERIVGENDVWGYCLSFVQDPIEPNLMFLGTEFGLYVSVDAGKKWTKWTHGFPTVSTMDMKIHPREHDLVIGTFGRSAFVLDDIRPLREIATEGKKLMEKELHAFAPPTAVKANYRQATGTRFAADAIYAGENRRRGAMMSFYLNPKKVEKKKKEAEEGEKEMVATRGGRRGPAKDSVKVKIYDASGALIRTLRVVPDTGVNRMYWGMDKEGPKFPSRRPARPGGFNFNRGGQAIMPGTYKVVMSFRESMDSTQIEVIMDPRSNPEEKDNLKAMIALQEEGAAYINTLNTAVEKLKDAQASLKQVNAMMPAKDDQSDGHKAVAKEGKAMSKSITEMMNAVFGEDGKQGIYRDPNTILNKVTTPGRYLRSTAASKNGTQRTALDHAKKAATEFEEKVEAFMSNEWKAFTEKVKDLQLSPFKDSAEVE